VAVLDGEYALASPPPVVVLMEYNLCWCVPFLYALLSALASLNVNSPDPSVAVVCIVITVADPGVLFNLASILRVFAVYGYESSESCKIVDTM